MMARVMVSLTLLVAAAAHGRESDAAASASSPAPGLAVPGIQTRALEALKAANTLVRAHQPGEAITVLDPVLAEYGRAYVIRRVVDGTAGRPEDAVYVAGGGGQGRRVYGSRSVAETLAYMLLASTHSENAIAIEALWGNALELRLRLD